jgi:putative phage-type endonuclease
VNADEREWREWRRAGIGGSDIAALIGLSRYASPTSLFYEKLGVLDDHDEDTPRQRIGKRMETVLAEEFNDMTGLYCVGEQEWCQHPIYPWARCTIDGFAADSPYGSHSLELALGTVQMKTDGRFGWPDGIPPNIQAQCIWEMGVTGLANCYLTVMFAGFRVEIFEIPWNDDTAADWAFMLNTADTFWTDHVLTGVPPALDDHEATTAALTEVHGLDPAGIIEADDNARALVYSVQHAMAATAAAEATEKRWKNELRAYLGDKTDLVGGWTTPKKGDPKPIVIASWRPQTSRRIDTTALRNAEPAIADKFTIETPTRVLRIAELKEPAP